MDQTPSHQVGAAGEAPRATHQSQCRAQPAAVHRLHADAPAQVLLGQDTGPRPPKKGGAGDLLRLHSGPGRHSGTLSLTHRKLSEQTPWVSGGKRPGEWTRELSASVQATLRLGQDHLRGKDAGWP